MCIAHTDRGTLQTLHRHSAGALVVVNSVLSGQKRRHDCLIFSQKKKKKVRLKLVNHPNRQGDNSHVLKEDTSTLVRK